MRSGRMSRRTYVPIAAELFRQYNGIFILTYKIIVGSPCVKGAGSAKPRLRDCVRIKIVVVVLGLSTGKFLFPDTYAKPPQKSKHFSLMCFTNDAFTQFGLPPLNEILSFVY